MKNLFPLLLFVSTFSSSFSQHSLVKKEVRNYSYLTDKELSNYQKKIFDKHDINNLKVVDVEANILKENTLSIDLPNGLNFTIEKHHGYFNKESGYNSWSGQKGNVEDKTFEYASFVEKNGLCRGYIYTKEGSFILEPISNRRHILYEVLESEEQTHEECGTLPEFDSHGVKESFESSSNRVAYNNSCGNLRVYNVMIGYSTTLLSNRFQWNRENLMIYLHSVIHSINDTYINSGLNVRARLAYAYEAGWDAGEDHFDTDFDRFTKLGDGYYDEAFGYALIYDIHASVLLTNASSGTPGRAHRDKRMTVYVGRNAGYPDDENYGFGVAHEIGHMLNLEHNREEFNWWERTFGGLDSKQAYGKLGNDYRTVMSYTGGVGTAEERVPFHSGAYSATFPDGTSMTSEWAKCTQYVSSNINTRFFLPVTPELPSQKTVNTDFATGTYHVITAVNRIKLESGFKVGTGSNILAVTTPCFHPDPYFNNQNRFTNENLRFHEENKLDVEIVPNPIIDYVEIGSSINHEVISVSIYDLENRRLFLRENLNTAFFKIDTKFLKSGLYFLLVETISGTYSKKIIKL